MKLHNIVDAIALRLFAETAHTQTQVAERLGKIQPPLAAESESAYKRSVTRLLELGFIKLVQGAKVRRGNAKLYQITRDGKDELEAVEKLFLGGDRNE
jgi:DNA-binding PadR family transcriptional regulator